MASQLLCRSSRARHTAAAMHSITAIASLHACTASAVMGRCTGAIAVAAASSARRSLHASAACLADPPKAAGKKKKEAVAQGPMVVPTSMSQYEFGHINVWKEYKDPADKVTLKADAAYPSWIYDQTPEPTWGELLLADFASLPPTYQKKVFSIPRKQEIKRKNDLTRKG